MVEEKYTDYQKAFDLSLFLKLSEKYDVTNKDFSNLKDETKENEELKVLKKECERVIDLFNRYGIIIVKDPRVNEEENWKFLDQMEEYFGRTFDEKKDDIKPELHFQVGATPGGTEKARNHCKMVKDDLKDKPVTICPPEADPKWRFFWRIGEKPKETQFKGLNAPQVVPKDFPGWSKTMDRWGGLMLGAVDIIAKMSAIGLGLKTNHLSDLMKFGPHLLAPTGSNLKKHGKKDVVFAGFHYDLNLMTIHGKSRYPGLFVWLRDGKRIPVKVPDGCLLIQAGKQFEMLTGGYILAGFHEVCVADTTLAAIEKAKKEKRSLWRVSSTLFSHVASDNSLKPFDIYLQGDDKEEILKKYPDVKAGTQVQNELNAIKLGNTQEK